MTHGREVVVGEAEDVLGEDATPLRTIADRLVPVPRRHAVFHERLSLADEALVALAHLHLDAEVVAAGEHQLGDRLLHVTRLVGRAVDCLVARERTHVRAQFGELGLGRAAAHTDQNQKHAKTHTENLFHRSSSSKHPGNQDGQNDRTSYLKKPILSRMYSVFRTLGFSFDRSKKYNKIPACAGILLAPQAGAEPDFRQLPPFWLKY